MKIRLEKTHPKNMDLHCLTRAGMVIQGIAGLYVRNVINPEDVTGQTLLLMLQVFHSRV